MFPLVCQVSRNWQIIMSLSPDLVETCDLISRHCSAVKLHKLCQGGETLPMFPSIMGGWSITESAFLLRFSCASHLVVKTIPFS